MIVALQGGLGNQLFQAAFGRSVSIAKGEDLFFENHLANTAHHKYALADFRLPIKFNTEAHKGPAYVESLFKFDPAVYTTPPNTFYNGFFQTEKYFNEPVLREEIRMKTPLSSSAFKWVEKIMAAETSCFIHVRRGDYLKEPHKSFHGNLDMNYYNQAVGQIHKVNPETRFFIFSDDPAFCKMEFNSARQSIIDMWKYGMYSLCEVIDCANAYESLFLMKLCHHAIIANSSFSWWGAWLGDEKLNRTVIAPRKWFSDSSGMIYPDVIPDRWVKIDN